MKLLLASLLPLALGLSPAEQLDPGAMRSWRPSSGPAVFASAGLRVTIEPAPCDDAHPSESCSWEHINNQAIVTIAAPGLGPFRVETDNKSSSFRIGIVRFDRRDSRPGVVIENDSGGSAGDMRLQIVIPEGTGFRTLWLPASDRTPLQNGLPKHLADLSGDGRIDLVLGDGRFGYRFGCGACTPRPPRVFTLRGGQPVDVSREPAYARIYREDMARLRPVCMSDRPERNGACAAYVADAARIGRFEEAWALMLRHHERDPGKRAAAAETDTDRSFPDSLRAFLKQTGYIP